MKERPNSSLSRKDRLATGVIIAACIIVARLFWIQIVDEKYKINVQL